jgi:hypothetical protein
VPLADPLGKVGLHLGQRLGPAQEVALSGQATTPRVLKKGILTSLHESPEQVAERLTAASQAHYAPALARAKELAATAQAKETELQVLRPLAEGLPPEELEAVRRFAAELRAEAAKRQEQERRVAALPHLVRKHGPVATFARLAIEAIKQVADAWQVVDWKALEQRAFKQIMQDGWSPRRGMKEIVDHSPAHAGQSQEQLNAVLASLSDQPIVDKPPRTKQPGSGYSR